MMLGAGRISGDTQPARVTASHTTKMSSAVAAGYTYVLTRTAQGTASGTFVAGDRMASSVLFQQAEGLELLAHHRGVTPELGGLAHGQPAGPGQIDLDDGGYPSGTRRHHDDVVGEK